MAKSRPQGRHPAPPTSVFVRTCRVSAKRFYPNFLNLESSFNRSENNEDEDGWNENDPKRYLHEVATMGKH